MSLPILLEVLMVNLLDSIKIMIDGALAKAPFDSTRNAVIIKQNSDGTCLVRMDGNQYTLPLYARAGYTIDTGETVKVIIPCNNMNKAWILPKV